MRIIIAIVLTSCAPATSQHALATAIASKQLVEQAYEPWQSFVEAQIERCLIELPASEHTKSEFDTCLGPALQHETTVLPALEIYHAAALGYYVAITLDQTDEQIERARADLVRAVGKLVRSIPAVDQQIERVQQALGQE